MIIVGSGPAGYTAALYTARANLEPLVAEGFAWGGLLQQTTDVENFPGFPDGHHGAGADDAESARRRSGSARALETDDAISVELSTTGGLHKVVIGDEEHLTRTVILAMGAQHRKLGVEGEEHLAGRGVSYCATCDAAFFRGVPTLIVGRRRLGDGGGDVPRQVRLQGDGREPARQFRASKIMLERARAVPNIEFLTPYVIERFVPGDDGSLRAAALRNSGDGSIREIEAAGAFVAIGHEPQSQLVARSGRTRPGGLRRDRGTLDPDQRPGVFAAGDLVDHTYRQAVTAAGSGCQAALDAERYLRDTPAPPSVLPQAASG